MKFAVFVLSMLLVLEVAGQYPKLIIQLKDKSNTGFSLSNPLAYFSAKAIERRTRFQIPVDSTDLPVSAIYVDSIKDAGAVTILSTSKWLNQVLIETTDQAAIKKIQSFPFVQNALGVGYRKINNPGKGKFREMPNSGKFQNAGKSTKASQDIYDYGNNYNQVHLHDGEFLHNKGLHGENMRIALLDAGFQNYNSETAFDSLRSNNQIIGVRDFVAFDNSVSEDDPHGMYCLSVMAANWPGKMVGTSPKANYWLIRTENASSEYPVEEHNWVVGAEFADSAGCDMISSSLGYDKFDDPAFDHSYADFYKNTTTVSKGASMAVAKGMIVTNSAGNEGNNNWKYLIFPADADSVCAVGSVSAAGNISSFSSYGYPGKIKPNIVSVGENAVVAGLNNEPTTLNGTSFSNPNIAGLIACLWQAFPSVSNMKILSAVYQSADRFLTPDDRYGFGIPDFKTAYRILKHQENIQNYGDTWLFATPENFTGSVAVKVIGQTDGPATIQLINTNGNIVASYAFISQQEELYNYTFANLSNLPAGLYTLRYSDSLTTKTLQLEKGDIFNKDWLVAVPNPFGSSLTVYLQSPETGEAFLRLVDAKGSTVEIKTLQLTLNERRSVTFDRIRTLAGGIYFLQYVSKTQKRTIKLLAI